MAFKHLKTTTESVKINGMVSDDGNSIVFINKDKDEVELEFSEITKQFIGMDVSFSISTKEECEVED